MSKPKTGKMTDAQILFSVKDKLAKRLGLSWAIPDVWTDDEYLELIKLARQQGIAQGRADCKEELKALKVYFDNCLYYHEKTDKEKQAYEKGKADVISQLSGEKKITVEVLNEAKRQGGEKAVADFKAKLTRIKTFQKATEDNEEINYTKYCYIIEKAIKEAERK